MGINGFPSFISFLSLKGRPHLSELKLISLLGQSLKVGMLRGELLLLHDNLLQCAQKSVAKKVLGKKKIGKHNRSVQYIR